MAACVSSRPRIAEGGGGGLRGDEVGEARLDVLRAAGGDQVGDLVLEAAHVGARHAERLGTHGLDLAHGNAAGDLREVFAEGGGEQQLLDLAEAAFAVEPRAPAQHLAQALDGGREPGEAVRRMLCVVDAAGRCHCRAHADLGRLQHFVGGGDRSLGTLQQCLRAGCKEILLGALHRSRHRYPPGKSCATAVAGAA